MTLCSLLLVGSTALLAPALRGHPSRRPAGADPTRTPRGAGLRPLLCAVPDSPDGALDELIKREVQAAFAGMESLDGFNPEEEAEMDALIASKGDAVMRSVLSKLESDGEQLAGTLEDQVRSYTRQQQVEMLKKFDEDASVIQRQMAADRAVLRTEATRLTSLQSEWLGALQKGAGGAGFSKSSVVAGISFIAGLAYLGTAVNEALRLAFGDDGSVATLALNSACALLGVGYYFYRRGQES